MQSSQNKNSPIAAEVPAQQSKNESQVNTLIVPVALDTPAADVHEERERDEYFDEISNLPLSARAINCLKKAGIVSIDEMLSLSEQNLSSMKNMGAKTSREIINYCENISTSRSSATSKPYGLMNIAEENKAIPVPILKNIGVSQRGIDLLIQNGRKVVNDLCGTDLTNHEYSFIRDTATYLSVPVTRHFTSDVDSLKDSARFCMLGRCDGTTLQEIGAELKVTRERARQIINKTSSQLRKSAELVAGMLLSKNNNTFNSSDLQDIFADDQIARCCSLVLQESNYIKHFNFSDKFVLAEICPVDAELSLKNLIAETIGEGINYNDNLELIESGLAKRSLSFFDFEDIMNYLIANGYHFYGDYVTKGKQSYSNVCYDAVLKFFNFDIKLDSDENNEDMRTLRQIIAKHYQGSSIPPGNRALTAGMTRSTNKMILSGRGRYCPIEKVIYSAELFDEVCDYIQNSPQTSFYYNELYTHFEDRFKAETNISNFNFLHGMLKCLFPNDFVYERDLLVKNGSTRQDVNDRLCQLLLERGRAVTKAEIRKAIPGLNDFVISFSVMRLPELIPWDYNEFNHTENIIATQEDLENLDAAIKLQTDLHNGYCSDALLYKGALHICRDFIEKNNIQNAQNLFYTADYMLGKKYRFRRPHIVTKDFPVQEITVSNITRILLKCEINLNFEQYCDLAEDLGWAIGTRYAVFAELEKDYIRITDDDYIHRDRFNLSQTTVDTISKLISGFTDIQGYCSFSNINDYETFPECEYEWNGFLLESVIREYDTGFRIIIPQVRDRRYQKGIIVPDDSPYSTFESLIVGVLKKNEISSISEAGLEKFLKTEGLIVSILPQEVYECPDMVFKNELFTLKGG